MVKILIVDDSITVRAQTKKLLSAELPESEFVLASSGEEAMGLLDANVFDLCILDYNMDGITGLDLAQEILKRDQPSDIYLCTANAQAIIQQKCQELGIGFMEKPIDIDRVVAPFKMGA
ncbi:MAG: response regulator [Bdellovibrionota bacterium]|nr:response regulator [Bdellovibrionota bacterium]